MKQPPADPEQTALASVPADVIARKVGDTTVLVRLQTNRIYELNATGARIWELMKDQRTRADIIDTLAREFDAGREAIATAVDELLTSLRAEGLA